MGYLHKIAGKLTGLKRMIKSEFSLLNETQLLQIDEEIGKCGSKIIDIMRKNE